MFLLKRITIEKFSQWFTMIFIQGELAIGPFNLIKPDESLKLNK